RQRVQHVFASIDPRERAEPEVEDIMTSVAEEFVESIVAFTAQLAKHRGSDRLDPADLRLHL
ncbi:hypothetical protein GQ42DRAFT_107746, partial [Ramicandelaber brevisporus]